MKQINNIPKSTNPNLKVKNPKTQRDVKINLRFSKWERLKINDKYHG